MCDSDYTAVSFDYFIEYIFELYDANNLICCVEMLLFLNYGTWYFCGSIEQKSGGSSIGARTGLGCKNLWCTYMIWYVFDVTIHEKCEIQYFYDAHKVMHIKVNKKTDITVICKIQTKVINI